MTTKEINNLSEPVSHPHPSKKLEILYLPWEYNVDGLHFIILSSYPWDGASMPPVVDRIVGHKFDPDNRLFSCFHDGVFRSGIISWKEANRRAVDLYRRRPDVGRFKRWLVLKGLMAGSWIVWRRHRKKSTEWQKRYIRVISLPKE